MPATPARHRRKTRVNAQITRGRSEVRPQLTVFRSAKALYAQITQDGKTLIAADDRSEKGKDKTERAAALGKKIAERAVKAKITTVVFNRNGFAYHGRVKACAQAARQAGLTF